MQFTFIKSVLFPLACLAIANVAEGASVVTYAGVNIGDEVIKYSYNYGGDPYLASTGSASIVSCISNPGPPALTCGYSASGTLDSTGNLQSATDSVSVTVNHDAYPPLSLDAATATGSAFATASLASGSVGVQAAGTYLDYRFPSSGQAGGNGSAFAQVNDLLHFYIAGATANTVTDISVSFVVDGNMTVPTPAGDSYGNLDSTLAVGNAILRDSVISSSNTGLDPVAYTPYLKAPSGSGWVSYTVTPTGPVPAPGQFVMTGIYAITGATADIGIQGTLDAQCGLGTNCDYSHTGSLQLGLPTGVTYTSDSGVFLTSTTPEPGSLVLLAGALLVTGLASRRARLQ